ncbi:MAG: DUF975 family protein [Bacillota bacterium]|nr:DUF975 family protein [Bacillota bacterium]
MQESMIGQNIVITEPSKNLRALGRNALAGKWKTAIITVILLTVCVTLPPLVFDSLFGVNLSNVVTNDGYTYGMDANLYAQLYNTMPRYSILSSIYVLLIMGPLTLGITMFFLAMFRQHRTAPVDLFLGFEQFGKSLRLFLFQMLFIFLWTLLFIIPGIIASIRYSQAFYILADDPSKGIRQCMDESKAMMIGNKAKYFWMTLSFIGWEILSGIPAGIFENIGRIVSANDFVIALFSLVGSLFLAPVTAYMYSTMAGFYEMLAGHLIKETEPAPIQDEFQEEIYALANEGENAAGEEANDEENASEANDTEENDTETKSEEDEQNGEV